MNDDAKAQLHSDVHTIVQRAKTLNERMRSVLRTLASVEHEHPEFAQELRHYGIIAEFADIANSIGDLDTAVAALLRQLGLEHLQS
ncbi:MAG TPA: hypothetical protein VIW95_06235 [Candidatus Binatus sp.]|uniref:hypothetical protein n=1 Tax=Candidatus Binatus sp. TaxID=2811406 RepID=UPI002F42EC22